MAVNPFVYVEAASFSKVDAIAEHGEKAYLPYMSNKSFSLFVDTIHYANDMNRFADLPKKMNFDYFRFATYPKKRYAKWPKVTTNDDIKMIQEVFDCNKDRALEYLEFMDAEKLNRIRDNYFPT